MNLDGFSKSATQIALSNVANKRKSCTPLLSTIFKYTKPARTKSVELVYDSATGKILPIGDRATTNAKNDKNTLGKKTRHSKSLTSLHVTAFQSIDSDEVQDIPEPTNKESLEQFESYVSGEVMAIEEHLEATREFHALGAVMGKVVDTDGRLAYDLYDLFGVTKKPLEFKATDFDAEDGLKLQLHRAKSEIKSKLKGKVIKGFLMLCGADAYEEFAFSVDVKNDTKNNQVKYVMDGFSDGFNYQSIDFVEYDGGIGEINFMKPNEAVLVPIVDGLFCITATPGKGTNHVNKRGQKTYITTKIEDHDAGVELKGQANYVVYSEVPDAVKHITITVPEQSKK